MSTHRIRRVLVLIGVIVSIAVAYGQMALNLGLQPDQVVDGVGHRACDALQQHLAGEQRPVEGGVRQHGGGGGSGHVSVSSRVAALEGRRS